ncbi:LOW QUALITY PROTEIN: actin cytoskeleton-regulatory complex protein PAN1 [Drosophila obscura]|uniref:LOW QUALITY PROTEIN: actin cytoskeleton-regulatory complex protein PAN1 n=1 Tax=Drosophila obscura TaxID=7282 RepID=UPI001BB24273|nr:LOW QUALITY PROTEIN: actin cytoskeleton-regulatory complex protein PAN1 [Drosophila obscura]
MSHQQFHHYHQHHHLHQVQSDSQLERTLGTERNQHQHQQPPNPNRNSNTERVSRIGSMDFRNLCQRLDVDGLRAKLPSFPSLPPLKLPKSLPKLRGRKIFRSSRRNNSSSNNHKDVAGAGGGGATAKGGDAGGMCTLPLPLPPQSQQFINRTPQRISTISSLMYEEQQEGTGKGRGRGQGQGQPGTYRSAGSLDDDYYAPESGGGVGGGVGERASRPISPVKMPSPPAGSQREGQSQPTLTQRLQRGYKSLSELRLKHLFAKQTVVRRDNIEVDRYVEQYEAELRSEQRAQARRDRQIADNYDIRFKTLADGEEEGHAGHARHARQEERSKKPPKPRSVAEQSGDESGMEGTPPLPTRTRKPGIAATRFAKVRQPPLQMEEEDKPRWKWSWWWRGEGEVAKEQLEAAPRRSSCKQLFQKLPSFPNSLASLQKRSKVSEEEGEKAEKAEKGGQGEQTPPPAKSAIRQNIKRLRKSIKRPARRKQPQKQPQKSVDESDEEEEQQQEQGQGQGQEEGAPPVAKSSGNLRARLIRFASTEQLQERWRKSFKTAGQDAQRSPKAKADDGAGAGAGAATGMAIGVHLERTLTKLNEKMHQLKFFQRQGAAAAAASTEEVGGVQPQLQPKPKPNTVGHEPVYIDDDEELAATYHRSDSDEDDDEDEAERGSQDSGQDVCAEEAFGQQDEEEDEDEDGDGESGEETQMEHPLSGASSAHAARQMATLAELQAAAAAAAEGRRSFTAWSSESLEEIPDEDYPRVLIHQEHTDDSCESTLIIAVSTKPSPSPSPLPSSPAPPTPSGSGAWLPNAEIISSFKEQQLGEAESWPGARSLYKPKSIDIFEASGPAFADFDEALRNAPILRISAGSSCDTSGDEEADDSSSRVTRIRMQPDAPPRIGNSRESLMAQEHEEEEEAVEEEEAEEESTKEDERTWERPPSASPPPPPLPQRRPPQRKATPPSPAAPIYDAVPPPLPTSKPPPLSMTPPAAAAAPPAAVLPQRSSASMSRPAKPLVKTSSLRLTYNEQVHPGDIGKVNKLISRFEGGRRPRLCPRRLHSEEYELHATSSSFSGGEEEEEKEDDAEEQQEQEEEAASPITPTNRPVVVIPEIVTTQPSISNNNNNNNSGSGSSSRRRKEESLSLSLDQCLDRQNSNCSRSEYGSPLAYPYPSKRRSSTGAAPPSQLTPPQQQMLQQQQQQQQLQLQQAARQQARRSRRSMTRDDENFYSFDSDEENSYYSISPSGSSRYVVEI